jgi:CheY-like chemotaxis protein
MTDMPLTTSDAEKQPSWVVLVVDDEPLIRAAIGEYLQDSGCVIHEAGNASEAITILMVPDNSFDVVFTDINMPGPLDGYGLNTWIKANKPSVSVLLTSGRGVKTSEEWEFIAKPYTPESVIARIEGLMRAKAPKAN